MEKEIGEKKVVRTPYDQGPDFYGNEAFLDGSYRDYDLEFFGHEGVLIRDNREFSNWDQDTYFLPGVTYVLFDNDTFGGGKLTVSSMDKIPYHMPLIYDIDFSETDTVAIPQDFLLKNVKEYHGGSVKIASVSDGLGGTVSLNNNGDVVFQLDSDSNEYRKYFLYTVKNSLGKENAVSMPVSFREPHHPRDLKFFEQWPLFDTRIPELWDDYTGKGVNVLIHDSFAPEHRDIELTELESYVPTCQMSIAHGLAVAGVVGAGRDGNDLVGIAYDANLYVTHINNSNVAIPDVSGFDIINNSWR